MKPFHYNQDPLYAAAASILTGQQQLTEEVVAFKNEGFKLVNGLMSDEDIHDAVNSTIKSVSQKLGDSTWDVVTDIYGKRENGEWGNDWILQRKGGGAWLTIKDGGPFKAHDSISSVLSFFKIEEEMEDEEMEEAKDDLKSLSLDQLKSQLASLDNQIGRLEDKQGFAPEELKAEFRAIDAEIESRKGMKEGDEGFYSQKMIKNQLQTIVRNSNTCLEMIDAGREFPEWAQSEIAVAEDGIVSVTEFMQSHTSDDKTKIAEAGPETKYTFINAIRHAQKMGNTSLAKTTTSNFKAWAVKNKAMDDPEVLEYVYDFDEMNEAPSPFKMGTATITAPGHKLDGKHVHIFHKFDDGRINVQYPKSDKKGDVLNITLTKGQYKLDDEVMGEEYTIKTSGARAAMEKFTMLDAVELEDFLKAASMYFAEEGESEGAFTNLAELFGKAAKAWSNRKGN